MSNTRNPIRKPHDGVVASLIAAPLAEPHARRLSTTAATPNQVTAAATALSILGSWLLGARQPQLRLVGFFVHQYGFVLDCADGQLARLTGTESSFGAALDEISDRAGELYLIDRLASAGAQSHVGFGAVVLLLSRHLLSRVLHTTKKKPASDDTAVNNAKPPMATTASTTVQPRLDKAEIVQHLRAASNLTIGDRLGAVTLASVVSPKAGIQAHAALGLAGVIRDIAARSHRGIDKPGRVQVMTLIAALVCFPLAARATKHSGISALICYFLLTVCRTLNLHNENSLETKNDLRCSLRW